MPGVVIQTVVFPVLLLVMFYFVSTRTVTAVTGRDTVSGLIPLVITIATMFGGTASAVSLVLDLHSGLVSRLRSMPLHPFTVIGGQVIAEGLRVVLASLLICLAGTAFGFRVLSPSGAVVFLLVVVVTAVGFGSFMMALAVATRSVSRVAGLSPLFMVLMFFNSGFVPVSSYPAVLRPIVAYQPFSCAIDAMRAAADGTPFGLPLLLALAWFLAATAVFGALAVRSYRERA